MINNPLLITSIINELEEKLNNLAKYLTDPVIGFGVFIVLLIIGCAAIAGYSKR